jgi:hypothetical protein
MVELVFLGDDDSSTVVKVYAAQAEAIRKGLAALAGEGEEGARDYLARSITEAAKGTTRQD